MAKRRRKSTRRKSTRRKGSAPKALSNELTKAISAIKRAKTAIKRKK